MAEGKKSFIAYSDWHGTFKALPDEIAGQLIKYIFSYVNDEKPQPHENFVVNALFEQVKATLKRDLDKWEKQREQRSRAGKKSAELRATKSNERSTSVNETERKATVSVNVNDNVNDNTIVIEDLKIFEPQKNELTEETFLKRWCDARTFYDKQPTNIKKLTTFEKIDFAELKKDYELLDFEKAMTGLFQQKTFPKTRLRPSHFLKREHFETYLTCYSTKEKLFEDKKFKKPLERI